MRVLGIDLGTKRIGLAVSDPGEVIASPLVVVRRDGSAHRKIADVVGEWEVEHVVVGLPLSLDGSVGPAAASAIEEAQKLRDTLTVPVETYDERLTTKSAEQILRQRDISTRAGRETIDKVAAAVLLQAWLDRRRNTGSRST